MSGTLTQSANHRAVLHTLCLVGSLNKVDVTGSVVEVIGLRLREVN